MTLWEHDMATEQHRYRSGDPLRSPCFDWTKSCSNAAFNWGSSRWG